MQPPDACQNRLTMSLFLRNIFRSFSIENRRHRFVYSSRFLRYRSRIGTHGTIVKEIEESETTKSRKGTSCQLGVIVYQNSVSSSFIYRYFFFYSRSFLLPNSFITQLAVVSFGLVEKPRRLGIGTRSPDKKKIFFISFGLLNAEFAVKDIYLCMYICMYIPINYLHIDLFYLHIGRTSFKE